MAKKSKHENNGLSEGFEEALQDDGADLLAEKNKDILSSFGKGTYTPRTSNQHTADGKAKPLSPIEALQSKVLQKSAGEPAPVQKDSTEYNEETSAKAEATTVADSGEEKDISLLEKLKRYTTDETGHDVSEDESPLYKLESVAQIIKNDSSKLINKLSEKYDVTIDTLGKPTKDDYLLKGIEDEEEEKPQEPQVPESAEEAGPTPTPEFERMAHESKKRFEKNLFDELFGEEAPKAAAEVKSVPDISDIDNIDSGEGTPQPDISGATVRFTPVADRSGNTGRINISSSTKPIDIRQELTNNKESDEDETYTPLETSGFDLFLPKNEITDLKTAKAEIRRLSYKKRRNFLSLAICSLCVFVLLLFLLPFLADKTISSPKSTMTVCSIFLLIPILANIDMFKDIAHLFGRGANHDCIVSLCAVMSVPLCVISIVTGENVYHLILLAAIIMLVRSAVSFMQTSTMLSNLKKISYKGTKHALTFIKDSSTALAMAKNAIEGDVLVAVPRKAEFISDFMKFSLFKKKFGGKMPIVFAITLAFSALGAVIAAIYYKSAFAAVNAAAVTSMIAAMPVVCLIDVLPLFAASRKLNKKGAMIAGTFGADSIELANAATVSTSDIFPAGTVVLKNFKVLSNNNIDKTLVNAAALTEAIGSPLAPVFNKIAGTNTSYQKPDSDTIKYEERLGISGWVDNELLFIGNSALMRAHGIEVPSLQVEKKILSNNCFPVYVATGGQACALVVIEYKARPDIQKVLRKISKLGITLLVDNCDPNVNEDLICDYFGLFDDSVKIMTNVGTYMYKNATADTDIISAPAVLRSNKFSLLNIMCCAANIRISNIILSIFYILAAVFGVWYFVFTSFAQSGGLMPGSSMLTFELLATAFAFVSFLFKKP